MESLFILVVAVLTSVGAYVFGIARLRFPRSGLRVALGRACECLGLTLVFCVLNLAVAVIAIVAMRSLSGRFVSLYIASDTTLVMLSLLQALTFQAWREGARQRPVSEARDRALLHHKP